MIRPVLCLTAGKIDFVRAKDFQSVENRGGINLTSKIRERSDRFSTLYTAAIKAQRPRVCAWLPWGPQTASFSMTLLRVPRAGFRHLAVCARRHLIVNPSLFNPFFNTRVVAKH